MKIRLYLILLLVVTYSFNTTAKDILVTTIAEYNLAIKKATPGTTIVLKNGIWADVKLNAYGNGQAGNPIIVKAETPGKVIITGNSTLNIYGSYVIVSGLWFKDGNSSYKSVVQFRKNSKVFANNCRFTNSTISYYKVKEGIKDHWVDIWGKNNRVDHNNFTGKTSPGTTLVVWLKGQAHVNNNHKIDNNIFGPRPELGSNGGETIRIGTSTNSLKSSKTTVEKNIFASCNGEIEIISNKSGDNIFRDNLFVASKGSLTLRHGNNALVERNVFLGNDVPKTGGIRVINKGHIIRNNLMIGLKGTGYRGAIVVMNGVPNSPLNRYHRVENVDIQNNTIINSGPLVFGAGKDDEKSLAPKNVNFSNNLVFNNSSKDNVIFEDDNSDIDFNKNYIDAKGGSEKGFYAAKINWLELQSFPIPTADNPKLLEVLENSKSPKKDINNMARQTFNAGAFNLGSKRLPKALTLRAGPGWKPNIIAPKVKPKEITVAPGLETLRKAIRNATPGSILKLQTGDYILDKKITISKDISIIGDAGGATILSVNKAIKKPLTYMFRVAEGAKLHIRDVVFDGETSSPKYALSSPDKNESGLYSIFATNVSFINFKNTNGGSVFKAYTGTKADTLSFVNSRFENNYRGLNLSYDKDNIGAYNANIIVLRNTVFKDIEEAAVNYIRNTPNVNIPGGALHVNNCVFTNVYNTEKGKILRVDGIHTVSIKNTVFYNSYKVKTPVALKGKMHSITNSLFYDSGFIKLSQGASESNLIYKNPKWDDKLLFIPSDKSPLLKKNNTIARIGLKH